MAADADDGEPGKNIVGVGATIASRASIEATARLRHNLALHHYLAALHFCDTIRSLEDEHEGEPFGGFFDTILWNFSACIILSVATLEAYLNETFEDVRFDPEIIGLIERRSILDRYQYFLKFRERDKYDPGRSPFQNIAALIALRNEMVHFKPEWDDEQGRHRKLEERLPTCDPSPFINAGDVFFPKRCISHGYTCWAVDAVYYFLEEFASRIEQDFKLVQARRVERRP